MELVIHRDKLESSTEREREKKKEGKERKEWSRKERNVWKEKQGKQREAKSTGKCGIGMSRAKKVKLTTDKDGLKGGGKKE